MRLRKGSRRTPRFLTLVTKGKKLQFTNTADGGGGVWGMVGG